MKAVLFAPQAGRCSLSLYSACQLHHWLNGPLTQLNSLRAWWRFRNFVRVASQT